jgi:hypothetical protein
LTNNEARNVTLLGNLTTTNTTDTFNISPFLSQFFIGSNYWGFSMTNGTSIAWTNGVLTQSGGTNTSWLSNLVVTGWTSLRGAETNTTLTGPGVVAADANGGRSIATIGTGLSLAAGVLSATGGGSGGFVTPFNNNQFGSAGGTTNIKSGATLTNINFYGPLVWATNAQSQKLDWAVGAPPVQGIITNASFDFDFLNGPPGVGSSATFSISNSAATSITVTFINTTAGAYSIQAGAAVSSVSVAAGAVMVQNWFYNGLNYYVDYSTKAGSGGTVTSVGVDATGTGLVVISTPVTTSGTINLRSGAPIVTNNFASSMLFSNAVKIDAASALSISNVVAGSLLKVNAGNQVAAAVAGDVPDLSSLYISRNAGSGTNVTIKGNADGTNALWVGPTGVVISNALGTVTIKGGNQTNSQNIEAASLDIIGAMTGARGGFGAAADATLKLLVEADGLGTTANNGIYLKNATAAAAGAQQYSPGTTYEAQGWKTASTAASQSVKFFEGVVPVQGTANPSGFLVYSNSINGGTWTEVLRISSAGDLTAPSLNTPGNLSVSGSAGITGLLSATAGIASGAAIDVASGAVTLGADGSVTFTGAATGSGSGLTGIPESGVSSLTSDLAARVTASGGTLTANDIILGAGTKDVKRVAGISSDGTSKIIVGVAGTSVGSIEFKNATSGSVIVSPPTGALGTINVTWPNASSTLPIFGQQITFSGPTAARTITLPDAAFTAARTDAGQTFTGTQNITTIDLGNTDTTLTRSAAGVMAVEGHDVLTTDGTQTVQNKTIDSANNVIKLKGYIQLKNFDNITGAKPNNTNDYTVSTFMKPVFLNGTAATANFIQFEIQVPTDFDTAVDPKIKITDKLTAADTGVRRYVVSTISPAASAAYDGTVGTAINVDIAADASGASGDVEQSSQTTLTGWGAALTPGRHWIIQIGRDGNSGTDTSTVDSMFSVAEIEYGVSQFTITVTNATVSVTKPASSSVCYVITGQEGTLGGASPTPLTAANQPNISVTTTRVNSVILCACSDWAARAGTPTARLGTISLNHDVTTSAYRGVHIYHTATTATAYGMGYTGANTGGSNACGVVAYEVRTP